MNKKVNTVPFKVSCNGKEYECTRTIEGEKSLKQSITVAGFGTEVDPAVYRNSDLGHSPETMEGTAILIATEIIRANTKPKTV